MSVSLSAKPASQGQEGGPHGSKERSPRLENSRDMPGHSNGAGRIKQRVLTSAFAVLVPFFPWLKLPSEKR